MLPNLSQFNLDKNVYQTTTGHTVRSMNLDTGGKITKNGHNNQEFGVYMRQHLFEHFSE